MAGAKEKLLRAQKSRVDILQDAAKADCVEGCHGQWKEAAEDVLVQNGLEKGAFCTAIFDLLQKGRGKYRNMMITGPANCGKTFILQPLSTIYECFCNPASCNFAWVGVQMAEIIFLNDFRWSQTLIPWHDLLLLLEGQQVNFAAPKSHFAKDITLKKDTPIFCTTKVPLVFVKGGMVDYLETEMMTVRWKIFHFHAQIPPEKQVQYRPCGKCFCRFILNNVNIKK